MGRAKAVFLSAGLVVCLCACRAETSWPVVCTPGGAVGFKPDSGQPGAWRQWDWKLDTRFVIRRGGAEGAWHYTLVDQAMPGDVNSCIVEAGSQDIVCDGARYLRLNTSTLRFVVAFEDGYLRETNSQWDRAYIALGRCESGEASP